jgi:hypothetical protein
MASSVRALTVTRWLHARREYVGRRTNAIQAAFLERVCSATLNPLGNEHSAVPRYW